MVTFACAVMAYLRSLFLPRHKLALEAVALRQQLAVFKRKQPRPKLDRLDRLFWIVLRRLWEGWFEALIIVKPETVVSRHRAGFRRFWRWRSQRRRPGRPQVNAQIRQLIRRMKAENPTWGAPRIHGELLQLGFDISEPTVSRYLQRLKHRTDRNQAKRWLTFLQNHREVIAACDFFTVPTLTFRVLYCFFCDRASSAADSAFQCSGSPDQRLDRSAAARSFSARVSLPLRRIRPRPQVR